MIKQLPSMLRPWVPFLTSSLHNKATKSELGFYLVLESEVCKGGSGEGWVDAKWEDQGTSRVFEAWLKTTRKDRNSCLSASRPLMLRIATFHERN